MPTELKPRPSWRGDVTDDIKRAIAVCGATKLVLAPDVFASLSAELEPLATISPDIQIVVRPTMPKGHGFSCRDYLPTDGAGDECIAIEVVWALAPDNGKIW